tara:strand:+ start:624 stop:1103 length:480 start_codon:yes stop_codon:yes gene_type:complete
MNREQIAYEKGYRVTKDGNLLNPKGEKIGCVNTHGYEHTGIRINKKQKNVHIHRLQAYQKYGNKLYEDGIIVRHLNSNSLDNSFNNISIGTQKDNYIDMPEENKKKMVYKHIKYRKQFVLKLREEYKVLKNYSELGRKYNMDKYTIWYLINKRKVFKDA